VNRLCSRATAARSAPSVYSLPSGPHLTPRPTRHTVTSYLDTRHVSPTTPAAPPASLSPRSLLTAADLTKPRWHGRGHAPTPRHRPGSFRNPHSTGPSHVRSSRHDPVRSCSRGRAQCDGASRLLRPQCSHARDWKGLASLWQLGKPHAHLHERTRHGHRPMGSQTSRALALA